MFDELLAQTKALFPNVPDDELNQGLQEIKKEKPDASNDEILQQIGGQSQAADQSFAQGKDALNQSLAQKYNLGAYNPEARAKLVQEQSDAASPLAAALAGFGAGLRGGDVGSAVKQNIQLAQGDATNKLQAFDQEKQDAMNRFTFDQNIAKAERGMRDDAAMQGKIAREKDPTSAESILAQDMAKKMGYSGDLSKLSAEQFKAFSPYLQKTYEVAEQKAQRQAEMAQRDSLSARELAAREKEHNKDLAFKREELARREAADAMKADSRDMKLSEGQKTLDKKFAEENNEWDSRGRSATDKNVQLLKESLNKLEKTKGDFFAPSGNLIGRLPDIAKSEEAKSLRQDVQRAAQSALKSTLGSAFTEAEGQRIMDQSYDETLSPEQNIKKIKTTLAELEANRDMMNARSKYFRDNRGSLADFDPSMVSQARQPGPTDKPKWAK